MTTVTADFTEVQVSVGNADGPPETFTPFCLVNMSKSVAKSSNLSEDEVPDCANPGDPADIRRQVRSIDYSISGEGKLHVTDLATALGWVGGAAKNCQIDVGTSSNGGYRLEGPFLMQSFEIGSQRKETATATIQLVPSDTGSITETALT
jgi:hypothetical protein